MRLKTENNFHVLVAEVGIIGNRQVRFSDSFPQPKLFCSAVSEWQSLPFPPLRNLDVNFKISICFFIISLTKGPGCSKKGWIKGFWALFFEVKKIHLTYLRRESIFNEHWAIELGFKLLLPYLAYPFLDLIVVCESLSIY